MKALLFFISLFTSFALAAQPDCTLTDSLYNELDAQATQIILNEMIISRRAEDSPIEFDSTKRAQYLSTLFAV